MKHYVCTGGCGGLLGGQAADCPNHGHPLEECGFEDGLHGGRTEKSDASDVAAEAE